MRRFLAVVAVMALVACGDGKGAPAAQDTTIDTGQGLRAPASSPTTAGGSSNALGTEVKTARGNTVTVYAYQPVPLERGFPTPAAGSGFGAIDVGGCVFTTDQGPDPQSFDLVMPDASRLRATFGLKKPDLRPTRLAAGECVRGWVTYEVPLVSSPVAVVFNASSLVRWAIP